MRDANGKMFRILKNGDGDGKSRGSDAPDGVAGCGSETEVALDKASEASGLIKWDDCPGDLDGAERLLQAYHDHTIGQLEWCRQARVEVLRLI